MNVGAHWAAGAYAATRDLGVDFVWLNADTFGDPAFADDLAAFDQSGLKFVLNIPIGSEDRLFDTAGCWRAAVQNVYITLKQRSWLHRCLAIQFDDEFYSALYTGALRRHPVAWPTVAKLPPVVEQDGREHWTPLLPIAAQIIALRALDVRAIFGDDLPAGGLGMAESGGVDCPNFRGQDWWGLNFYLGREGWYLPSIAKVAALYQAAADKGLRLMPIVGVFAEDGHAPVGLAEMAACYLPLLERHRAHILAVGVFCAHHPGSYDPRNHGKGRGVLELGEPYIGGVRWLTGYLHRW